MPDFHKLMQSLSEINAKDVSEVWQTIEANKTAKHIKRNVGVWHSEDGQTFTTEIGILNTGGRMFKIHIGPDGKLTGAIILPDMD
jgi:hypothetical protein